MDNVNAIVKEHRRKATAIAKALNRYMENPKFRAAIEKHRKSRTVRGNSTPVFGSEERYLVVLEKRKNYILLITAFYVNYDHSFQKLIKAYEKAKGASIETPSETPSTLQ